MPGEVMIGTYPLGEPDGAMVIEPYRPEAVYQIDDLNPWLCIAFDQQVRSHLRSDDEPGYVDRHPDPPDGKFWYRWQPIAQRDMDISSERRFGHVSTLFRRPYPLKFQCYVWPGRLFDRVGFRTMLDEIAADLGTAVEWERAPIPIRAYVGRRRGAPTPTAMMGAIRAELLSARALERSGQLDDEVERGALGAAFGDRTAPASPEIRLLAMWALRRQQDLQRLRRDQRRVVATFTSAARAARGNPELAAEHEISLATAEADQRAMNALAARVTSMADRLRTERASFELSPAMQRNHRLRRLLNAFAPTTRESIAVTTGHLSTLPPLKAPSVFELWGAIRIGRALGALGWYRTALEVGAAAHDGAVAPVSHFVARYEKDGRALELVFNPRVHRIVYSRPPPVHERRDTLLRWALKNLVPEDEPDGFVSVSSLTPDYAVRLMDETGSTRAIVLGDATLSDPKRAKATEPIEKTSKLAQYQRGIAWRVRGGRPVMCAPHLTFIVLPGPSERWDAVVDGKMRESDVNLLYPDPGVQSDEALRLRVGILVDALIEHAQ